MGANEKAAAAYHGGEHTPSTEQVRQCYRDRWYEQANKQSDSEFDRWLDQLRNEAKAEALEEAADELGGFDMAGMDEPVTAHEAAQWLRARVAQIKRTK